MSSLFSVPVDRHGTYCTQWDFVQDRFGQADLLPFTISDMDFVTAPVILKAISERTAHGVFGYSRWQHNDFLSAVAHWFSSRFQAQIDTQALVYGPSVIYMVSQMIRLWSQPGDGVVVHTPAYDAFYKTITGNQRTIVPCPLQKTPEAGGAIWMHWDPCLQNQRRGFCCCAARITRPGKSGPAKN
ncbi:Cystathionine beta-lyase (CBL) (Beta-cystathionase) (Cysteine lyase) / Maltose regulon modulator [Morganella morganii IS15]|nr:Cystathionine beta-lyase (CBL) (Beta-cystathionase) (Cysteine lyase) / Maltose regulon modulator [Morganella morganii IS15]